MPDVSVSRPVLAIARCGLWTCSVCRLSDLGFPALLDCGRRSRYAGHYDELLLVKVVIGAIDSMADRLDWILEITSSSL